MTNTDILLLYGGDKSTQKKRYSKIDEILARLCGVKTMRKQKSKNYQEELIESLKNPGEAAEYLNSALEENEPEVFLMALRNVADAFGGMNKLSKETKLNRENLYRMLSKKGNPGLYSLNSLLEVLGLKLAVQSLKISH